jgi:uncharacterized MAPEG superfamily protein
MQDWLLRYASTIWAMGAMGGLLLVQIIVLDVAGIRAGHTPGLPVEGGHDHFHFRATRAHANTTESIAIFILLAVFGIFANASPRLLNGCALLYVAARLAHMLCYYAGIQVLRSLSFVVAFLALIGMLVAGFTGGGAP